MLTAALLDAAAVGEVEGCTTILRGAFPTGSVALTVRDARSTTETSFEFSFVTYATLASGESPIQCGIVPTLTLPIVVYDVGSNRSNVPGPCETTMPSFPS